MPSYDILGLGRAGWLPMVASFFIGLILSGVLLCQAWLISRIFATLYSWDLSNLKLLLGDGWNCGRSGPKAMAAAT